MVLSLTLRERARWARIAAQLDRELGPVTHQPLPMRDGESVAEWRARNRASIEAHLMDQQWSSTTGPWTGYWRRRMNYVLLSALHVAKCDKDLADCDTCEFALFESDESIADAILDAAEHLIEAGLAG